MITLRKLASLKDGTRHRKYPLVIQSIESDISKNISINTIFFHDLLTMIAEDDFFPSSLKVQVSDLKSSFSELDKKSLLWKCSSLRYKLLASIGAEPGDWDFEISGKTDRTERIVRDYSLFLDGIRSPFNVGSIFRTAESFGIRQIFLSEDTTSPEHNRARRSSMGCTEIVPWSYASIESVKGPFFALELGGVPLEDFSYPQKGTLIIGSEELGVSPDGLKAADAGLGRLSIKTGGVKGSINVSVATGIALQKWFSITG